MRFKLFKKRQRARHEARKAKEAQLQRELQAYKSAVEDDKAHANDNKTRLAGSLDKDNEIDAVRRARGIKARIVDFFRLAFYDERAEKARAASIATSLLLFTYYFRGSFFALLPIIGAVEWGARWLNLIRRDLAQRRGREDEREAP